MTRGEDAADVVIVHEDEDEWDGDDGTGEDALLDVAGRLHLALLRR